MKNQNRTVCICVPVYGVEKYIERCARSLFEQTYKDIEYLFVDDCSPDRSIEILKSVMEDYPERKERVRIIMHDKNRGLGAARNTAVENCETEFIMHVDSDDSIEKNTVEIVMAKQAEGDYDIVSFGFNKITSYNKVERWVKPSVHSAKELALKTLSRRMPVCVWGALYRTSLYTDNGIRVTEGVNNSEDYCVTPRLAYYASRVCTIPDTLYNYYFANDGSYTVDFSESKSRQSLKALQINEEFFQDKDKDYIEAMELGKSALVFSQIRDSLRNGEHSEYYKKMLGLRKCISLKYISTLSIYYKILLHIDNYKLACVYYRIPRALYRLYYRFINLFV